MPKLIQSCEGYYVGQQVSQQFPQTINDTYGPNCFLTDVITGTIEKIIETRDAAFATIRQEDGKLRLVILG